MPDRFWDAKAATEEVDLDDEPINRALRWRVIERHLDGVDTVLDIGGGTGAFSLPLASRGYRVTHLDRSPAMIAHARARAAGLSTITFVDASAEDLSQFSDQAFDLVLNMDGAVSFSGARARAVIAESCRVARRTLIVTASNRACMVPTWLKYSVRAAGRILPCVHAMLETGFWHKDQFPDNALIYPAFCDIETLQSFLPAELATLLRDHGMEVQTARSLGSLPHMLLPHGQLELPRDELLALCEAYDTDIMPAGPGSFRRAGLLAVANRPLRDPSA